MDTFDPSIRRSDSSVAICYVNFWPAFTLSDGLFRFILEEAFGTFHTVPAEQDADIVLTSVFPHAAPKFPEKSIGIIWENIRPNYQLYRYSISADLDSYGGRNSRIPNWYRELDWGSRYQPRKSRANNRGFEKSVDIDVLMTPREHIGPPRAEFCCFVSKVREVHRALAVQALSRIAPVKMFGDVVGEPLLQSKYEILPRYRFNLCFENSMFPGYYTERIVHAWAGGCIPLYYSDPWYTVDFNAKSMINRIDFPTLEAFVDHVAEVNRSPERMAALLREPLLHKRPRLDDVIAFLRCALSEIAGGASGTPRASSGEHSVT
jgi:hypothetical protein